MRKPFYLLAAVALLAAAACARADRVTGPERGPARPAAEETQGGGPTTQSDSTHRSDGGGWLGSGG